MSRPAAASVVVPVSLAAALVVLLSQLGCSGGPAPAPAGPPAGWQFRPLDAKLPGFLPDNRARIDQMMRALGYGGPGRDPGRPPVAVFDWDNTCMKNDIGDATIYWMLRHDRILQPPKRDWGVTNRNLTPPAQTALHQACDQLAEPGKPLPTSTNVACADAIFSIYDRGKTPAGERAFQHDTTPTMHQPYAWGAQLQAGYTPEEVRGFAKQAYVENAAAPIGATQQVGSVTDVVAYVRIYEPIKDLFAALRHNGFDVWVVSASSQPLVEVVGKEAGLPVDHVVGVRTLLERDGKLMYRLAGCGTERDGVDTVITFDGGKRCWINKAIFKLPPEAQLAKAAEPRQRPALAAGDSDTDLAMVQDATHLKLILNRNKVGVMCNAYANHERKWLVQPMFIAPMPQRAEPYPCSTARDVAGKPLVNEVGQPMPDAMDRVFGVP